MAPGRPQLPRTFKYSTGTHTWYFELHAIFLPAATTGAVTKLVLKQTYACVKENNRELSIG